MIGLSPLSPPCSPATAIASNHGPQCLLQPGDQRSPPRCQMQASEKLTMDASRGGYCWDVTENTALLGLKVLSPTRLSPPPLFALQCPVPCASLFWLIVVFTPPIASSPAFVTSQTFHCHMLWPPPPLTLSTDCHLLSRRCHCLQL